MTDSNISRLKVKYNAGDSTCVRMADAASKLILRLPCGCVPPGSISTLYGILRDIRHLAYKEKESSGLDFKEDDDWRTLLTLVKDKGADMAD